MDDIAASLEQDAPGLLSGKKASLAKVLARLEQTPDDPEVITLLDKSFALAKAHVLGVTGPPGVGKSTLLGALIAGYRGLGQTVGVIAVDPSSRQSGGALLGDRTRLVIDPDDEGVFVRSMAARDRLGGLAGLTVSAMVVMRAIYDIVILETVGVGQSETEVVDIADTVLFCVQPGSGDSLQFMKAGIAEIPHIVAVTKADLGAAAVKARADVEGALGLTALMAEDWQTPILTLSARSGPEAVTPLMAEITRHAAFLNQTAGGPHTKRDLARHRQAELWLLDHLRERYGREGVKRVRAHMAMKTAPDRQLHGLSLPLGMSPFGRLAALRQMLAL